MGYEIGITRMDTTVDVLNNSTTCSAVEFIPESIIDLIKSLNKKEDLYVVPTSFGKKATDAILYIVYPKDESFYKIYINSIEEYKDDIYEKHLLKEQITEYEFEDLLYKTTNSITKEFRPSVFNTKKCSCHKTMDPLSFDSNTKMKCHEDHHCSCHHNNIDIDTVENDSKFRAKFLKK